MKRTTPETDVEGPTDALLTKRGLAPRLHCSIRTVDEWMRKGRIPYIKAGKTVRFRWADVIAKLNEYRVN
jgi:excisionase family DNA binding protein